MANKAVEKLLIEAALAWWQGKCPVAFTLDEHLKNPAINTKTTCEYDLALAVAATFKKRHRRPAYVTKDGMRLLIDQDRQGHFIAWYDEDGSEGLRVGHETSFATDPEIKVTHEVVRSMLSNPGIKRGSDKAWRFDTLPLARAVVAKMNLKLSLKGASLPEWAKKALDQGWIPPSDWRP